MTNLDQYRILKQRLVILFLCFAQVACGFFTDRHPQEPHKVVIINDCTAPANISLYDTIIVKRTDRLGSGMAWRAEVNNNYGETGIRYLEKLREVKVYNLDNEPGDVYFKFVAVKTGTYKIKLELKRGQGEPPFKTCELDLNIR